MKKITLAFLMSMVLAVSVTGQVKQVPQSNIESKSIMHNGYIRCHTMEADSIRRAINPGLGTLESNEAWLQEKIGEHKVKHNNDNGQKLPVLVIPVVVHVIHNGDAIGSGENIADAQVLSQIQVLNEDYRRILGSPGFNSHADGADVEIEFCMAVVDEAGNATTGIDRVNTGVASYNTNASVETMKTTTFWDPTQYMNIWSVRFGGGMGGVLGYAQFPDNSGLSGLAANGGAANTDGVVSSFDAFGSATIYPAGNYNPTYNLGRTMTHEVGHWLGLRHIWGDGNCGVDDFCADTPESDASNFGCPAGHVSCGTTDMIENYMDYTDDNCMNIFTQDQKDRIRTVMLNSPRRMELPSSTKCTPPNADDGGITLVVSPTGVICGTTTFTPIVILYNYGNNDITSIDIIYDLDGGASSTFSWTGTLNPGSAINVNLPAMTSTVGAHTFNVATNLPNGNTDSNAANDGAIASFTISLGNPATLVIDTDCWGYETYWEIQDVTTAVVAFGGNTGTTIPPGGGQTATNVDAGSYGDQTTITENVCLATGCYDFIIYDDWGDGMAGGGTCAAGVVGDYTLTDDSDASVLASMIAAGAAFGNSETTNFCIGSLCTSDAGTMDLTTIAICGTANTITATHNGDEVLDGNDVIEYVLHDGSGAVLGTVTSIAVTPTFGFVGGMTTGITYYISAIVGDDDGSGSVDQTDACMSVATGTPVVWNALPTVVAFATNSIICAGDPITLTGSGATSYTWDNSVTDGVAFNPAATTTYTVTGTDGNGCQNTDNITVTVNTLPTVVANTSAANVCSGSPVTLTGSGAISYTWDNSVTDGIAFNPVATNTYTVTGTDGNGCQNTDNITVTITALPTVVANATSTSLCPGDPVTLTGSGAVSYTWDNGVTDGVALNPAVTNTYTVTGTDGNGCQNTDNITVTVNTLPTVVANASSVSVCIGGPITLTGSGAASYTWDNGVLDGVVFNPAATTTYTVTGTDGNGCQNTDNITVTVNTLPTVVANTSAANVCSGSPVTLTGSGAVSYTWDNSVTDGIAFNPVATNTYTVTGTDGNGCQNTDNITVTITALPTVVANATSTSLCPGDPVTLTGSGAVSYTWDNGVTDGVALNPAVTNTYTVTGTDGNGCQNTDNIIVTINALPTVVANASSLTICTGSPLTLTGSGATSYTWDNGVTDGVGFNPAITNTYVVTGTDGNGCQNTDNVTVTVATSPTVSNLIETCNGPGTVYTVSFDVTSGAGGYIVSGQSGSFSGITWTSNNMSSGSTYNITVTDANGCTAPLVSGTNNCSCTTDAGTMDVTVISVCGTGNTISAIHNGDETFDGNDVIEYVLHDGNGAALGTITSISATPIFGFVGGMTTGTTYYISAIVGNDDGSGAVDQTDACFSVAVGTPVVWNSLPTVVANASTITLCLGDPVTLTGTGAVSYTWDNGVTDGVVLNPAATNTYTVTGTDGNGCQNTDNITVTVNNLPNVVANTTLIAVCIADPVTLTGTGAVSYTWDNGVTDGVAFNPTVTNNYTVIGIDGNGCQNTDNITVTVNNLPLVIANSSTAIICAGDPVTLTGSGATSYTWDNGVADAVAFNPGVTNNYTVIGTDGNGCQNTDNVTVTVNVLPTVIASATVTAICTGDPVTLTGAGAASYTWDNGVTDGVAFNPVNTNTYTVIGTAANGCQNTDNIVVNVNALPTIIANASSVSACTGSPVILTGSGGATYVWDNGITDGLTFNPISTLNYVVIGTDGNGCQNTDNITVSVNALPTVIANATLLTICSGDPVTLTGAGAVTYSWDNGVADGVTFTPANTLSYIVTGTDGNGCINTDNITVVVNPTPTFSITSTDPTTCGGVDGSITLTGLLNSTAYQLTYTGAGVVGPNNVNSNGAGEVLITGLNAGSYTSFIIDLNSCSTTDNSVVTLTDPIAPTFTTNLTDEACSSVNGEIEINAVGGSGVYQYSIDNGSNFGGVNLFNGLSAGTYDIIVLDGNNCQALTQIIIQNIAGPTIDSLVISDVLCNGGSSGEIIVFAIGNSTIDYIVDAGASQVNNVFGSLPVGSYNFTVTDLNGCTTSQMGIINQPDSLEVSSTFLYPTCGDDNGSIELNILGGVSPYMFSWLHDGSLTNDTIINLLDGEYIVTVTDTNGCTLNDTTTLSGTTAVILEVIFEDESCTGEQDGLIEVVNITGGTPLYTYDWDGVGGTAILNNLDANIYQLTVTDAEGCFATETIVITSETDDCLNIHNAISPNNDGDNDTWVITGLKNKPDATVQIFNRWGSLIYEATDYQNDWRGTYKNKDLPAGVYYYIVTISADEVYQGSLTILR